MATVHAPELRPSAARAAASRARRPDATGTVERNGIRIAWARFGDGDRTVLLLPSWSIVHSRVWKFQIPYLARRYRVLTFDGRGNGNSDRPGRAEAYADAEFAADALAVMDATTTFEAVIVALSAGADWALRLAALHAERVAGVVFLGPALPLSPPTPGAPAPRTGFDDKLPVYDGWQKYNRHYWRTDYADFADFFFGECLPEPHSTKPIEDCVGWAMETDAETLILTHDPPDELDREALIGLARSVRCPVLVLHGSDDRIVAHRHGAALAELTGGSLHTFEGAGHIVSARDPVRTNLAIRAFIDSLPPGGG